MGIEIKEHTANQRKFDEENDIFYSPRIIESWPSSDPLMWFFAQSIAKTEALRNFLLAYFLQTYCR